MSATETPLDVRLVFIGAYNEPLSVGRTRFTNPNSLSADRKRQD
jgi:hypothetical protein